MTNDDARKRILEQMLSAKAGKVPYWTDTEVEAMREEGLVETDSTIQTTRAPVRLTEKGFLRAKSG